MKTNEVVAKFEKVSFEQFKKDWLNTFYNISENSVGINEIEKRIKEIYDNIKLPKRSTALSGGYDFFAPKNFEMYHNHMTIIPTGIRCLIKENWLLALFPRSGQGFKYGVHLANTVGIIDADYSDADNEGHIFVKLVNDSILSENDYKNSKNHFVVANGQAFCQGVFLPYGITIDDEAEGARVGGIGSTDK